MPISDYMRDLRRLIGPRLVLAPGVAAIVRDTQGDILLERRSDNGAWGLPAGAIDPGETPAEAVVREVREETGLLVEPERLLGVFGGRRMRSRYPNGDEVEYTVAVFACRAVGGSLAPVDGEASELVYMPPEQVAVLVPYYPPGLFDAPTEALFDRR